MAGFGVIFDLDGVVFDSEAVWKNAFYEAGEKFGLDFTEEFRQSLSGKDENLVREEMKAMCGVTADVDAYRDYMIGIVSSEFKTRGAPVKDGFKEMVAYLKVRGDKLGLATSNSKERALTLFEKAELDPEKIFDAMVFGEDVLVSKPEPDIFLLAAKKMGVMPGDCFVLEDSPNGITAAMRGGFKPVMVVDLITPTKKERETCLFVADNLIGALGFLKSV
ncbi:MAG: HAD family phosphatase [Clostridia bacterium]|nr:HAD family phosphatase [Clostridia bacterium]